LTEVKVLARPQGSDCSNLNNLRLAGGWRKMFKLPERLEIVSEFPTSPAGKTPQRELRRTIATKLTEEADGGLQGDRIMSASGRKSGSKTGARAAQLAQPRPEINNVELRMWLRLLDCSNLVSASLRQVLRRDYDVSLPSFDILAQIARPPLGPTMGELSKRLMVSKGAITNLVGRLGEQSLVTTTGDDLDARVQHVHLTIKGKRLLGRMLPAHNQRLRELMADLEPATVEQLSEHLGELRSVLRKSGAAWRQSALAHNTKSPHPGAP
jgi:DNA-binding MarR family transcriptional regulator